MNGCMNLCCLYSRCEEKARGCLPPPLLSVSCEDGGGEGPLLAQGARGSKGSSVGSGRPGLHLGSDTM